jgi:hypothetical protein
MEQLEAARAIAEVDGSENEVRAARLIELDSMLVDEVVGFSGQAAEWLFEDVKATWIYGYLTGTVLTAYAFCLHQLAGLLRMLPDDGDWPEESTSLEALAAVAHERALIDLDLRAQLVTLHDRSAMYLAVGLHEYPARMERRLLDAELFRGGDDALLEDARVALACSVALLHRKA